MGLQGKESAVTERVLVVAAERGVGTTLVSLLTELGVPTITLALSAEHASSLLREGVDVAFLFADMRERSALDIVDDALSVCPVPRLVVVSDGTHPDLFTLARAGAQEHLFWPASPEHVLSCLEPRAPTSVLQEGACYLVGRIGIRKAQSALRRLMLQQALDASNGSRRAAARILGVTRAAVQHMLKEDAGPTLDRASIDSEPAPPRRPSGVVPTARPRSDGAARKARRLG
jgi:DNA-binding NtrC family response regulator